MCGIAGFCQAGATLDSDELSAVVGRMIESLRHRGPDDAGTWVDAEAGVALGHRRLSIVDLSPSGHQPMRSASGRYVVTFNGEIYNHVALRRELEASGNGQPPVFRGRSDTEVMLSCIERWGLEASLQRLNGMFAFALWDRVSRRLFLARDRLGEKPLFYAFLPGAFLFGSELKALRMHPAFEPEVDRDAVAMYLRHSYVPAPWSIYRGVFKLPPGHLLALDGIRPGVRVEPTPYWRARDAVLRGLAEPLESPEPEVVDRLDALLRDSVRLRMEADVPLGAFLSGGIDSSTVVALMQAQSDRPVRTFSIGFHEAGYDEAEHARAVARHLGTTHAELYVTPEEAMAVVPRLPDLYDEPLADVSQIPTFLVSQLARREVTVSLSGDGGDELFGGYNRYGLGRSVWRQIGWMPRGLSEAAAGAIRTVPAGAWDGIYRAVEPVLPGRLRVARVGDRVHKLADLLARNSREALYRAMMSHWKNPTSVVLGAEERPTVFTDPALSPALADFTDWMMYVDTVSYLPDDVLVKVDRASMAVALEARVPLLDHRVLELAWRIPRGMKVRNGRGKWILRQVLERYVPAALVERPKMGFGVPIGAWLSGPLRDWAEALLDEGRLGREGYLDPRPVRDLWHQHLSGARNWQEPLWDVLVFQAWLERDRSR